MTIEERTLLKDYRNQLQSNDMESIRIAGPEMKEKNYMIKRLLYVLLSTRNVKGSILQYTKRNG